MWEAVRQFFLKQQSASASRCPIRKDSKTVSPGQQNKTLPLEWGEFCFVSR